MNIYGELIQRARESEGEEAPDTSPTNKKAEEEKTQENIVQTVQQKVSVEQIRLSEDQPRKHFDSAKMDDLISSIEDNGVLEPLIVRPLENGIYELVAGERRLRASKKIGLTEVPVTIHELTETQARRVALVENLQREDLNPVEEVEAILKLITLELSAELEEEFTSSGVVSLLYRMQNESKGKVTHNVMGSHVGEIIQQNFKSLGISWKSFVSNKLPVLKWPEEVLQKTREGAIPFENAKLIARVKDTSSRTELLQEAISSALSVSNIRTKIESLSLSERKKKSDDPDDALKETVTRTLQTLSQKKTWKRVMGDKTKAKRMRKLLEEIELLIS